jgi:hypothetical protein
MTENTTNNDPWTAWVEWAQQADDDAEKMWGLIDTATQAVLALIDRHTKLSNRVAALETQLGIIPAPPTASPPADPAIAPGPPPPVIDDGAALIAQRQARAAARLAAAESAPGAADVAAATGKIMAHAQGVPGG